MNVFSSRFLNVVLFLLVIFSFNSCKKEPVNAPFWLQVADCDFENTFNQSGTLLFTTNNDSIHFFGAEYISNQFAKSGNSSLKVSENLGNLKLFLIPNLKKEQRVELSIYQNNGKHNGKIVFHQYINGQSINNSESTTYEIFKKNKQWNQHYISFNIDEDIDSLICTILVDSGESFFDNANLLIYPVSPKNNITESLNLYFPSQTKKRINTYVRKAYPKEIIPNKSRRYLKGFYIDGEDSGKIKLKIKGDWTDHIKPHKPSFRIKLNDQIYNGVSEFSVQDVSTRNYIMEWVYHKFAEYNDILTTKYSFINVNINTYNYGLYAFEEHFDKKLLESKKRREGPILKLTEDGYWNMLKKRKSGRLNGAFPFYEASVVSGFKINKTLKSAVLRNQFYEGVNLIALFKNNKIEIDEIFDIDQLAIFYVINALSSSPHGLSWHNRRFYFNPVTQKVEHILYDLIPTPNKKKNMIQNIIQAKNVESFNQFDYAIIKNKKFQERYFYFLDKLTSKEHLDSFFTWIEADTKLYVDAITSEYPNFKYDNSDIYEMAKLLQASKKKTKAEWDETIKAKNPLAYWIKDRSYSKLQSENYIEDIDINAFVKQIDLDNYQIQIDNYHLNEVTILGFSNASRKMDLSKTVKLKTFVKTADSIEIALHFKPTSVYYEFTNIPDKIFVKDVINYPKPGHLTDRISLKNSFSKSSSHYKIVNDTVIISGSQKIDKLLYLPKGYSVKILPGSDIAFSKQGGFIINGSFDCKGTEEEKINIYSIGKSNGITIINASNATIAHTNFDGLSNLNSGHWLLTGAITIYQTPTEINHVNIRGNTCEDALNIIRSNFKITNLLIENTFSDGFDADFCTGSIANSFFKNTGNDCIDFSGSTVDIHNVTIESSGDKGISGGEASNLTITNTSINGALIGIASKDGSMVTGSDLDIKNADYAYIAFRKKMEYPFAKMTISNSITSKIGEVFLIEKGSEINIDNKTYYGTSAFDIKAMYSRFSK